METTLFGVRTPSYDRDTYKITPEGIEQVDSLVEIIRKIISDDKKNVVIWSSIFTAANDTAKILQEKIQNTQCENFSKLCTVGVYREEEDFDWLKKKIEEFDNEKNDKILIVVTHAEYVFDFPTVYGYSDHPVLNGRGVCIKNDTISRLDF